MQAVFLRTSWLWTVQINHEPSWDYWLSYKERLKKNVLVVLNWAWGLKKSSPSALCLISSSVMLPQLWKVWGEVVLFFILWEVPGPEAFHPCFLPCASAHTWCHSEVWLSSLPESPPENMQGHPSLLLFLSISQLDEVMTGWQVYLGFPCLASSLNISGLNVSVYLTDNRGWRKCCLLALAFFPPPGPRWYLGRGEKGQVCSCPVVFCLSRFLQFGEACRKSLGPDRTGFKSELCLL